MPETQSLKLPLLVAEQAQKHVTHNEALRALDALVQLAVKDRDLAAPPGSPADGDRYIVAASPTGLWAGHAADIAVYQDGAWDFHGPAEGWRCWVDDENVFLIFNGSAWVDWGAALGTIQNLSLFGLGTIADATNPFSAKLNKALWTAKTAAEGGDGDLRYTLNKEAAADVLSFLLQRGFSGRAEIGLIGDDDMTFKVSPDGSAWTTALVIDRTTGNIATGVLSIVPASGSVYLRIGSAAGFQTRLSTAAVTPASQIQGASGTLASFGNFRFSADGGGPQYYFAKSRNATPGSHTVVQSGDQLMIVSAGGSDGSKIVEGARIMIEVDGTPGSSDMPGRITFLTTADGAETPTERLRIDNAGNLQMGGANTVIDASRHHTFRSYTIGTLPSAATAGQQIWCSDLGGGPGPLVSDGTAWLRVKEAGYGTLATDAAFTLTPLSSAPDFRHTGTLTANRALTLATTNAYAGARFRLTRTGGGAFSITHALKNLATNTWAEFVYDGAAWYLAAYGAL